MASNLYTGISNGIYIHYQPEHVKRYLQQKQSKSSLLARLTEDDQIKARVISSMRKSTTTDISQEEIDAYFDFLGGFGKRGKLQESIQKTIDTTTKDWISLQSPFGNKNKKYDNFYHAIDNIFQDSGVNPEDLATLNQQINSLLNQLSNGNQIYRVNQELVSQAVDQAIISGVFEPKILQSSTKKSEVQINFYHELKEFFTQIENSQSLLTFPKNEGETYSNRDFIKSFVLLQELLKRLSSQSSSGNVSNIDSKVIKMYVEFFASQYSRIMGFAYQTIVEYFPDIVVDDLLVTFTDVGAKNVKIKYKPTDAGKHVSAIKNTQDISIDVKGNTKNLQCLVKFNIPGMSVKYSSGIINGATTSTVKVKGDKPILGHLLHDLDNSTLSYIYNILANYHRRAEKIKSVKNPITKDDYEDMWSVLKTATTINGLIGQATADDFSYYFIFGKKVFTLPEIIKALISNNNQIDGYAFGIGGGKTMRLDPSQVELRNRQEKYYVPLDKDSNAEQITKAAQWRSQKVLNDIFNAKIKAGLSLKISRIIS